MEKGKKEDASLKTMLIASNKRAGRDYEILERYECGVELRGTEVKSIRTGRVSVSDSFARVERGQLFLYGCDVQPWESAGSWFQHEQKRPRRLLAHKREILKMELQTAQKGYALPLLQMYWKNGKVKVQLGVGRGKTHRDRRYDLKAHAEMMEARREVVRFNKRFI